MGSNARDMRHALEMIDTYAPCKSGQLRQGKTSKSNRIDLIAEQQPSTCLLRLDTVLLASETNPPSYLKCCY